MSDTMLVTYATRSGSTAGVAEFIGEPLFDRFSPSVGRSHSPRPLSSPAGVTLAGNTNPEVILCIDWKILLVALLRFLFSFGSGSAANIDMQRLSLDYPVLQEI